MDNLSGELIVFLIAFIVAYLVIKWQRKPFYSQLQLPPALPSVPILGSLPFLAGTGNVAELFLQKSKQLGNVFSFYAGSRYVIVLNGRETIHEAFVTRGADFADRVIFHVTRLSNKNGNGIINRQFDHCFKHVKQLVLTIFKQFGFGKRVMETRIMTEVAAMIQYIRRLRGEPFNPSEIVLASVGNVVLNVLFGRKFDIDNSVFQRLLADIKMYVQLSPEVDIFPVLRYLPRTRRKIRDCGVARESLAAFCEQNITACLQKTTNNDDNFVRSYVDAEGPAFDRVDLNYTLRDLIVAGTDTVANTVLWFLVMMANHRSVQDRLHAEIDSVVGKDRLPILDDRCRLPYTEAAIMETMRQRRVGPLGVMHATLNDTRVNGYFVPSGTMVIANLYSVNMDPDSWLQPDKFYPARFLDGDGFIKDQEKIIPFSLGKRSCLGEQLARQEIFLFVAGLLQHFEIYPPEGKDHIDDTWTFNFLVPPPEFKVRLISRQCELSL
jgi:cytochrome P450